MKHWIFVVFCALSFSVLSLEVNFESFSATNSRHLRESLRFCEQTRSLGASSSLFADDCDLTRALTKNTKEIVLVYNKTNHDLISILRTQLVREKTTILVSGSFLVDFRDTADIYKTMFERIQELSIDDDLWRGISWVAINREIFNRVTELDERLFPVLFSHDEQLFVASSISSLPRKDKVEVCEHLELINWYRVGAVFLSGAFGLSACFCQRAAKT